MKELKAIEEISKTNLPIYAVDVNSKFEIEPGLKTEIYLAISNANLMLPTLKFKNEF